MSKWKVGSGVVTIRIRGFRVLRLPAMLFAAVFLARCVYLPALSESEAVTALPPERSSTLARQLDRDPQATPRALLIDGPEEALTSRLHLIEAAEHSLDLQYFIWQNDYTGILLIEKLIQAADRGVRVRAVVDDVRLIGLIDRVSALNQHPNIEVRIYNPFSVRFRFPFAAFQVAEFAIDGNRLNHRMHNKLLVADNQLAILGGRNIGDDYFGFSDDWYFIDTDLLLSGSLVTELSDGFDVYWNSRWSYPVEAISRYSVVSHELESIRNRIHQRLAEFPEISAKVADGDFTETVRQLLDGHRLEAYQLLVDDPNVGWFDRPDSIAEELAALTDQIESEVIIVTPYLVPTSNLLDIGEQLIARGVRISVLTNSLATNNHVSAHAAYSQFRARIMEMGVELYEFRADARMVENTRDADHTMHSKYILFDEDRVFVGSMNLDPRSLYLNTELGVMLQSRELAAALRRSYAEMTRPENAYRLISAEDSIEWHSDQQILTREPAKSRWQLFMFRLMQLLPLSSQL
ncbi:MAG: phospholipase D family protein [Gammaproteobacteria bacterium]|nr:phospholipase D family protein [Gammaproteobacteria bacterium]